MKNNKFTNEPSDSADRKKAKPVICYPIEGSDGKCMDCELGSEREPRICYPLQALSLI